MNSSRKSPWKRKIHKITTRKWKSQNNQTAQESKNSKNNKNHAERSSTLSPGRPERTAEETAKQGARSRRDKLRNGRMDTWKWAIKTISSASPRPSQVLFVPFRGSLIYFHNRRFCVFFSTLCPTYSAVSSAKFDLNAYPNLPIKTRVRLLSGALMTVRTICEFYDRFVIVGDEDGYSKFAHLGSGRQNCILKLTILIPIYFSIFMICVFFSTFLFPFYVLFISLFFYFFNHYFY